MDRLSRLRLDRREYNRARKDYARAREVARLVGVDWDSLDEVAGPRWLHMAYEMTHLRLYGMNNALLIAVRMALQIEATPEQREELRSVTGYKQHAAWEHRFFLSLPPEKQQAWYDAALAADRIFPSPYDRPRPWATA